MKSFSKSLFSVLFVALSFFGMTQSAQANIDPYIAFKLGYSHYLPTTFKFDSQTITAKDADSMLIGGATGISYKFTSLIGLRTELEYGYRLPKHLKPKDKTVDGHGRIETQSLLANIYADFYVLPSLNLYFGGGIGLGIMNFDIPYDSHFKRKYGLAAQGGVGMQYIFFEHLALDLNVRYTYLGEWKAKLDGQTIKGDFSAIEAILGIAYIF